ncbi:MAG: FecR family protein [Mediterranea sp.]|nr:FecR family protein [Mediterranea sp.]
MKDKKPKKAMRQAWNQAGEPPIDDATRQAIWQSILHECGLTTEQADRNVAGKRPSKQWRGWVAAACVAAIATLSGIMLLTGDAWRGNDWVNIEAHQSQRYLLPDSSAVWMDAGSTLRYAREFVGHRDVWLTGNALFEVRKQAGTTFRVNIDRAAIEVKGTCFRVTQNLARRSEVTLFNGKVDFVAASGGRVRMRPMQTLVYNVEKGDMRVDPINGVQWQNGRYYFQRLNLVRLTRFLSELYGVRFEIETKMVRENAFTGYIRYDEPLEEVLYKVCFTLDLTYERHDGTIYLK